MTHQTMLINENRLNRLDASTRNVSRRRDGEVFLRHRFELPPVNQAAAELQ